MKSAVLGSFEFGVFFDGLTSLTSCFVNKKLFAVGTSSFSVSSVGLYIYMFSRYPSFIYITD